MKIKINMKKLAVSLLLKFCSGKIGFVLYGG